MVSDVARQIRDVLNDQEAVRYSDERVFDSLNASMSAFRAQRPDLLAARALAADPDFPLVASAPDREFPLPHLFLPAVVSYAVAWLEMPDDEFSNNGRLQTLFKLSEAVGRGG
jgi:hypothetical protein